MRRRAGQFPEPSSRGAARVLAALEESRDKAYAELLATLRDERYVALLDRLVAAANAPALLLEADLPAPAILPDLVRRPWESLARRVKKLGDSPTDAELHDIRIRTKRVRYAAEAIAPLVGRQARGVRPSRRCTPGGARRPERRGCRGAMAPIMGARKSIDARRLRSRRARRSRTRIGRAAPLSLEECVEGALLAETPVVDVTDEVVRAAGGLVRRRNQSGVVEIVLVHRPAYEDWAFPKGKLHPGESEREAALREVRRGDGSALPARTRDRDQLLSRRARSAEDRSLLGDGASRRRARTGERGRRRALGPTRRRARGAHLPTGSRPSRAIRSARTRPLPVPWMTTLTKAGRLQAGARAYLRRPRSLSVVRSGSP